MTDKKQPKKFNPSVPENNWDWIQRRRFMNADAEITPPSDSYTMKLEDGDEFKVRKNSTSTDDDSLMNIVYKNKE